MASRLNGLALCAIDVLRSEVVDEEFARSLFLVAQTNHKKRSDKIVLIYDESAPFAVEIRRMLTRPIIGQV